jgi:transcriptional regulator with XRE-family HTH domain
VETGEGRKQVNFQERFKRLAKALDLTIEQMAEIFGTKPRTMSRWMSGYSIPEWEFRQTLLRLESENMPALSPNLSANTLRAFREGRELPLPLFPKEFLEAE